MKRFFLFGGDNYYPSGGWGDFVGDFDSRRDAVLSGMASKNDWWHVIDIQTKKVIDASREYENEDGYFGGKSIYDL